MGECRLYICGCGYKKQLNTGAGLAAQDLSAIIRCVPEEISARLLEDDASGFVMVKSVISCKSCKELAAVNDLTYTVSEKTEKFVSACPICGKKAKPLENTKSISCPKCKAAMKYKRIGFWD